MTRRRVLLVVGVVAVVGLAVSTVAALVIWQQPGEVKAVVAAVVCGIAALAALIGSA